jgi:hypothetical protein
MPVTPRTRHGRIFTENGSAGAYMIAHHVFHISLKGLLEFISELSFFGGKVGFVAGSHQYAAKILSFPCCKSVTVPPA